MSHESRCRSPSDTGPRTLDRRLSRVGAWVRRSWASRRAS